jgi:hypothetical protein
MPRGSTHTCATARGAWQVGWSPTRRGLLGTIADGSASLCVWDVDRGGPPQVTKGRDGVASLTQPQCERVFACESPPSGFSWHPTDSSRLLLLLSAGSGPEGTLRELCLSQQMAVSWSPRGELLYAHGRRLRTLARADGRAAAPAESSAPSEAQPKAWASRTLVEAVDRGGEPPAAEASTTPLAAMMESASVATEEHAEDVCSAMRWRAENDYALDPAHNLALLERAAAVVSGAERRQLAEAWQWMDTASTSAGGAPSGRPEDVRVAEMQAGLAEGLFDGACALLSGGGSEGSECSSGLHLFQSPARAKVLELCRWQVLHQPPALEAAIAALEAAGMFERAAVMALFQAGAHPAYRELERAVRSLERGGSALASTMPTRAAALRMMAMVAAGFQPSAQLWWSTVHSTARCVASQHLRLLLAVLCSPSATEPDGSPATGGVSVGLDSSLMLQHVLLESMDASQADEGDSEEHGRLLLSDGLAMACRFLPDQQLQSFLVRLLDVRRTLEPCPAHIPTPGAQILTGCCVVSRAADASCWLVGGALPHGPE